MYGDAVLTLKTFDQTGYGTMDPEVASRRSGVERFRSLYRSAKWARLWSVFFGRRSRLQTLGDALDGRLVRSRRELGLRTVPIAQIDGSEGRNDDFDTKFRPLRPQHVTRWLSIFGARQRGIALPPVELLQLGERYFVRDGHHRISVARALGQEEIEANVMLWE